MPIITQFPMTDKIKEDIKALIQRARKSVIPLDVVQRMALGDAPPVGDTEDNSIWIGSYRVVFSLEEQPHGVYKHMSVSCRSEIDNKPILPPPMVASRIMAFFGFKYHDDIFREPSKEFMVWKEAVGDGIEAINLIELDEIGIEPDLDSPFNLTLTVR